MLSPHYAGKHPGMHPTYTYCADRAQKETAGLTPLRHLGDLPRDLCLLVISRDRCLPKSPRSHVCCPDCTGQFMAKGGYFQKVRKQEGS